MQATAGRLAVWHRLPQPKPFPSENMATVITRILRSLRSGNSAGRMKTDDKGDSVWEWDTDDADPEKTSVLVDRLNNDELSLVDEEPTPEEEEELQAAAKGGGFDPYGTD